MCINTAIVIYQAMEHQRVTLTHKLNVNLGMTSSRKYLLENIHYLNDYGQFTKDAINAFICKTTSLVISATDKIWKLATNCVLDHKRDI